MADLLDLAGAAGHQGRDHHGRAGPQVAGPQRGGLQPLHPFDDGHLAVHLDVGPHLAQLVHVAEAVVPNAFGDGAGALGHAEQHPHLGLHIGGETRMGHGVDLGGQDVAGAGDPDGVVKFLHLGAAAAQLGGDGLEVLGGDVPDQDVAAGGRRSHHIGAGLDLVGDDAVGAAVHLADPPHLDHVGARAPHVGPAHIQKVGQVHHMGLLGAVFQHGLALGHDGGEHGVHGRAHADLVKKDPRALQLFFGADGDHAVIHAVLGAQSAERLQVLVDGAGPQVAAAGHGHLRPAEPGQQRAQEIIAGPHLPGQVVRHIGAHQMGGVDLVGVAVQHPHLGAQGAEDVQADGHVADVGQILDHTDTGGQDGGGQDAHRRVLRARNIDLAHQRPAACNNKLLQSNDLLHGVRRKKHVPHRSLHGPP